MVPGVTGLRLNGEVLTVEPDLARLRASHDDLARVEETRCFDPASHLPVDPNAKIYPCADCWVTRSIAQGARVFTVCDTCWDKQYKKTAADGDK